MVVHLKGRLTIRLDSLQVGFVRSLSLLSPVQPLLWRVGKILYLLRHLSPIELDGLNFLVLEQG